MAVHPNDKPQPSKSKQEPHKQSHKEPAHFSKISADDYNRGNRPLEAISNNLHFLTGVVLSDLPPNARILCVGVGTGLEIEKLGAAHPDWTFTGVEPAAPMLAGCKERVEKLGMTDRCRLVHGYLSDLPFEDAAVSSGPRQSTGFDAVLCMLVLHFIHDQAERQSLFDDMCRRIKPGGYLVVAEMCFDKSSPEFAPMAGQWIKMKLAAGMPPDKAEQMPKQLTEQLAIQPPTETEAMFRRSGLPLPVRFFQSFFIQAWFAHKE